MPAKLGAAYSELEHRIADLVDENERLKRSEARFRLLAEGVPDHALYMLGPDGRVTSWNAGARHMHLYDASEVVGQHYERFFLSADVKSGAPVAALERARTEGRFEAQGWRVRKDGSTFWASAVLTRLDGSEGELVGFSKITRDLTEQRAAEEALRAAQGLFASVARALKARLAEPASEQQFEELVDELQDITAILTGQLRLELGVFDAAPMVRGLVERLAVEAAESGGELIAQVESVVGRWDARRIEQVLAKLVWNAIAFAPGTEVLVSLSVKDGRARFEVVDGGPGMTPERQGQLLVRPTTSTRTGGLGVGLFVARHLVEAHGGTIRVSSEPDKGARFTVELPLKSGK